MTAENPEVAGNILEEKPPFLYHGTISGDIEEFEPRSALERPDENPAVYGSPNLEVAVMSMVNGLVDDITAGIVDDVQYVCIPLTREEFLQRDKGGFVYVLPNNSFEVNRGRGLKEKEWVSETPVKPIRKIEFPSLLQALLDHGIKVYFISPDLVEPIHKAQDGDGTELEEILNKLTPE